jgi:hypothetical protein
MFGKEANKTYRDIKREGLNRITKKALAREIVGTKVHIDTISAYWAIASGLLLGTSVGLFILTKDPCPIALASAIGLTGGIRTLANLANRRKDLIEDAIDHVDISLQTYQNSSQIKNK